MTILIKGTCVLFTLEFIIKKIVLFLSLALFFGLIACTVPAATVQTDEETAVSQTNPTLASSTVNEAEEAELPTVTPVVEAVLPEAEENVVTEAEVENETAVNQTDPTNTCPTDHFLAVVADSAKDAYAAPQLSVTCTTDSIIVTANGIPSFEFISTTPNGLSAQNYEWQIPLNPVAAATTSDVPLIGPIAIAVDGLPIFAPNEAPQHNYGDALLDGLLDYCNGHTAPGGMYHYHARPDCLFTNIENNPYLVIGYAFDGYPILAPYACTNAACDSVNKVESAWQPVGDGYQRGDNTWEAHTYVAGSSPLDECNGMTLADGSYAYFATDTFPYFLGCYHGVATTPTTRGRGRP